MSIDQFKLAIAKVMRVHGVRVAYGAGAIATGLVASGLAKIFEHTEHLAVEFFREDPLLFAFCSPALLLLATQIVLRFAPSAGGSGIPQVMAALEVLTRAKQVKQFKHSVLEINGMRVILVKVMSATVALLAGASIGREGPTAQIGAGVFQFMCRCFRRWSPGLELRGMLVAGAAAGIAAAFNAPLAGVTFALEELAPHNFKDLKNMVLISIIIAGATSQALLGNYIYFGKHSIAPESFSVQFQACVCIGVLSGCLSSIFCRLTLKIKEHMAEKSSNFKQYLAPILLGIGVVSLAFATDGRTIGPGRELALSILENSEKIRTLDVVGKFCATLFSFVSGAAGGIFAPSLSIGAGIGQIVAQGFTQASAAFCGILGMSAFLAGVTQAPLTAIVIVTEMTDKHEIVLPIMCASLVSFILAKATQRGPLYQLLSEKFVPKD